MIENTNYIKALGSLLATYETDLEYIARFQELKKSDSHINDGDVDKNDTGSFKAFINEFRVARNIKKEETKTLLEESIGWTLSNFPNDVDKFAELIKVRKLSHDDKTPVSLASKVLMLNNPWEILPIDSLTKKSLGYRGNKYGEFKIKLDNYIYKYQHDLLNELTTVEIHLKVVEAKFKDRLCNIESIRFNRYVDKVLWVGR